MVSDAVLDGVLLLGLFCLILSGYGFYWMATGDFGAGYAMTDIVHVEAASVDGEVVNYSQLPPAAQASFDAASGEDRTELMVWQSNNSAAVQSILDHNYVRKDGQLFEYGVIHADNPGPGILGVFPIIFGVAGILLVGFGLDQRYGLSTPT